MQVKNIADLELVEVLAELSGIAARDSRCDAIKQSIQNSQLAFQLGKGLLDATAVAIKEIPATVEAIELAELGVVGGPVVAILGGAGIAVVMSVAACEAFNDCSALTKDCCGFPPVVVQGARALMGEIQSSQAAAILQTLFGGDKKEWEPLFKVVKALNGPEDPGLDLAVTYADYILDAAIEYEKQALACCGDDCISAVCQQAARGCLLFTGSFWSGTEGAGLNCRAT
jgi:hypothetical protein